MRCKPLLVLCNKFDKEGSIGAMELVRLFSLTELLQEAVDNGPSINPPKTRVVSSRYKYIVLNNDNV